LVEGAAQAAIVATEELVAMHLMVLALLDQVVVVAVVVLGLMRAIRLPTATDHLLEEVLVFMD
jgi:hypothetical protein